MIDIRLLKALAKGAITFLPGFELILEKKKSKSLHSCSDPWFCYVLWFRILHHLKSNNLNTNFNSVAEIGSGGSLGLAICALLTGSKRYLTLEVEDNFNLEDNLRLLDKIVSFFKNDQKIPEIDVFGQINIKSQKYNHYSELIDRKKLMDYLSDERIEIIRKSISNVNTGCIETINDWEKKILVTSNIDFIFSRAVMEHVNDPYSIYNSAYKYLNHGGLVLHDIEFHSHNITNEWYSHLEISNFLWTIIKGKRKYYLNRLSNADHLQLLEANDYKIIENTLVYKNAKNGAKKIFGAVILAKKE